MFDSGEVFIEDDFYFNEHKHFENSSEYSFSLGKIEELEQLKELLKADRLMSVMDKQIYDVSKTCECLQMIQTDSSTGNIFIIREKASSEKIVGYLPVFYEYSDWRNGETIYINDLRVIKDRQISNFGDIIKSFMHFLKSDYTMPRKLTTIRWIIHEKSPFKEELLKAGLDEGHYRVYEKNTFS